MNLDQLWPAYRQHMAVERGLAEMTVRMSKTYITRFVDWLEFAGVRDSRDITRELVGRWSLEMSEVYTESQMMLSTALTRTFCKWLASSGLTDDDPAEFMVTPRVNRTAPNIPSPWEIQRLIDVLPDTDFGRHLATIIEVLYSTGMRFGELVNAKLSDLDLKEGTLRVVGKGSKTRITLLGDEAKSRLAFYVEHVRPRRLNCADDSTRELILLTESGSKISNLQVVKSMRRYARRAGINREIRPHILRHACASHMLAQGANIREVQELLGHASIKTTAYYTHPTRRQLIGCHLKCHPRSFAKRHWMKDPAYRECWKFYEAEHRAEHRAEWKLFWDKHFDGLERGSEWLRRFRPKLFERYKAIRRKHHRLIHGEVMRAVTLEQPDDVAAG